MAPEDAGPADHPGTNRSLKGKKRAGQQRKKGPARKKGVSAEPVHPHIPRFEDLTNEEKSAYPEWKKFLERYPMIDSLQREEFPDHGVSFVYLAHFYRTDNTAEEGSQAQEEFEDFFAEIGYTYDYSGNFDSRWFEGIGVKIR